MCLRNSRLAARCALASIVFVVSAMWVAGHTQAWESAQRPNAEAQKLKNPVPADAESVEAGKKLYQRHCASCHGPNAKGDGGLALSGGTPSDLTDDTWDYGSSDGVSSDMLSYKDKLNEKQIWQVVNYIRSLGSKPK